MENILKTWKSSLKSTLMLTSHLASVELVTNSNKLIEYFVNNPMVGHHLPGIKVSFDSGKEQFLNKALSYTIVVIDKANRHQVTFNPRKRVLYVFGVLGQDFEEINLVYNLQQFFTRIHQEMGLYPIHCGAVSFDSGAVLILGGERAGKSTLVSKLCSCYDAKYLCDERAILTQRNAQIVWIGGNDVMSLREDITDYVDLKDFKGLFENITGFSNKKMFLKIRSIQEENIPIKHVVFPRFSKVSKLTQELNKNSSIYRIFADLSIDIHGVFGAFLSAGYAMPSLDTRKLRSSRLEMANQIGASTIQWICQGDITDICNSIQKISNFSSN